MRFIALIAAGVATIGFGLLTLVLPRYFSPFFVISVMFLVAGLREQIKLGASGKITSGFRMASNMALGADFCNTARGFMFAVGCVQSTSCHTDRCPVGVATQNKWRQRALVVPDKAERVHNFHRATVKAMQEVVATVGLDHPSQLAPEHLCRRTHDSEILTADQVYRFLKTGELLTTIGDGRYQRAWAKAQAHAFLPLRR